MARNTPTSLWEEERAQSTRTQRAEQISEIRTKRMTDAREQDPKAFKRFRGGHA